MREQFRRYAAETMEAIRDGAMSGGMNSNVQIYETYMQPDQAQGDSPIVFDFQGSHDDGTTVMGEIVFRQFDIEPGDCQKCGAMLLDDYGAKFCDMCREEQGEQQ